MGEVGILQNAVGWLLLKENERGVKVLEGAASQGPATAAALISYAKIRHPVQFYRALGYLEERGLIDRVYDLKGKREVYSASTLGRRALEFRMRIMDEMEPSTQRSGSLGHGHVRARASGTT
jgi:hypothetical protein